MKQKRKGIRGISASSAAMGVFLAAVLLLFAVSALGASLTEPTDPLSASVSAAVNDAPRLCDSEENERVYIPTPVASGQSEEEKREQTDEAVSPEEEEPPPEEEEQEPKPEREEPKQRPETRAERENSLPDRSGSSGESGTPSSAGGIGGGENENGKKTDEVYFTTTIKDGETVTDPAYAFSVRHLKEELTVKKMTVSVNGEAVNQFNGAVALSEGKNVIRVKVDYADSGGKTVASPFKDYTVYLDTRSLVIQTSLKDETVARDQYPFTASASYQGEEVPLSVTFNGETVSGTGGKYRVRLKEGTNLFALSAKGGGLKKENQYTIVYQSDGIFDFETDLADGLVVTEPTVSFSVWMVNGADAKFTVTLTGKNAHAWAEYYRDGVGWIPFEVTPPYVYVMEQPDQISTPESELADSESDRQGMVEMEEDNYEDIEEEEPEREPEAKLPGRVIAAMAVGSLLLLVLAAFVILALRRRAILLARKRRIKKADDRESVDLIFRDILAILFASGIRRRNVSLESYVLPLKEKAGGADVGSLLCMAIDLHREAVFSDHPVSESRRRVFVMLRGEILAYVKRTNRFRKKFIDKYIKCVY